MSASDCRRFEQCPGLARFGHRTGKVGRPSSRDRSQSARHWHGIRVSPKAGTRWGIFSTSSGNIEQAADAYRQALNLDPKLVEATYDLAALAAAPAPPQMPRSYVTRLFDDFAATFERRLVDELAYRVPEALRAAVAPTLADAAAIGPRRSRSRLWHGASRKAVPRRGQPPDGSRSLRRHACRGDSVGPL